MCEDAERRNMISKAAIFASPFSSSESLLAVNVSSPVLLRDDYLSVKADL